MKQKKDTAPKAFERWMDRPYSESEKKIIKTETNFALEPKQRVAFYAGWSFCRRFLRDAKAGSKR